MIFLPQLGSWVPNPSSGLAHLAIFGRSMKLQQWSVYLRREVNPRNRTCLNLLSADNDSTSNYKDSTETSWAKGGRCPSFECSLGLRVECASRELAAAHV